MCFDEAFLYEFQYSNTLVKVCCDAFGLKSVSDLIHERKRKFLTKLINNECSNSVLDIIINAARYDLLTVS